LGRLNDTCRSSKKKDIEWEHSTTSVVKAGRDKDKIRQEWDKSTCLLRPKLELRNMKPNMVTRKTSPIAARILTPKKKYYAQ
jgi:hypothetical protein